MDHQELARAADAALVCRSPRRRGVAETVNELACGESGIVPKGIAVLNGVA